MCLGHLKMTYLRCPSDPDDDRRLILMKLNNTQTSYISQLIHSKHLISISLPLCTFMW